MAYGKKLRKEGKIEGLEEGVVKGRFQVIKSMLQEALTIPVV